MSNDTRLVRLETLIENVNASFIRLETKADRGFDKIDKEFDKVDKEFGLIDSMFERVHQNINHNFQWLVGIIITLFLVNSFMPMISKLFN